MPNEDETWTVISHMLDPDATGEDFYNFMRCVGACRFCGKLVFLFIAKRHTTRCRGNISRRDFPAYSAAWPSPDHVLARDAAVVARYGASGSGAGISEPSMPHTSEASPSSFDPVTSPGLRQSQASNDDTRDDEDEPQF